MLLMILVICGIKVNYATSEIAPRFYAIGHLTCGTFLYTQSIPHLASRAKTIVEHLMEII